MSQTSQNKRQPEPLETPEDILVKDGEQCVGKCSHTKSVDTVPTSKDILKEIIHRAVTFTDKTIEKDTVELNKAISQGYLIQDSIRTETGIVYVLAKWEKHEQISPKNCEHPSLENPPLKEYYNKFLERNS